MAYETFMGKRFDGWGSCHFFCSRVVSDVDYIKVEGVFTSFV